MWVTLTDCGKQLRVHTRLREKADTDIHEYKIIEVESDQYKIELVSQNGNPSVDRLHTVLNCRQMVEYHFEVAVH